MQDKTNKTLMLSGAFLLIHLLICSSGQALPNPVGPKKNHDTPMSGIYQNIDWASFIFEDISREQLVWWFVCRCKEPIVSPDGSFGLSTNNSHSQVELLFS